MDPLVGRRTGASTVRQYLAAGMLDELYLHIVPIILGAGERLLEDVADPVLEPVKVIASPAVTHVKLRVTESILTEYCISTMFYISNHENWRTY